MIASAALGSGLALAQSAQRATPTYVADDVIRIAHPQQKWKARLASADTDGDGTLSLEEAQAAGLHRIVRHFNRLDIDRDGRLTPQELRALIVKPPTT